MTESREARLKRLLMRSQRRGTQEMDLILGPYAMSHLRNMSHATLDRYEALLEEGDQDLLAWITGTGRTPERHRTLLAHIMQAHVARVRG